jgi:UDP-GlcNAc:undecaprenyl-phosphate GlcNAc-1-phosphate transferase
VAVAIALSITLGVAVVIDAHVSGAPAPDPKSLLPIISGSALVFAVGLWDDIDSLSPAHKLAGELLAAVVVVGAGLRIDQATAFGTTYHLGAFAAPATIAWILIITNAFNLMDGLDGLAGGLVTIAAATCATVLVARGEQPSAMLLVALIGAVLGFLVYNSHPARIFMGDSGSLLGGFLLAVTAITGQQKGATTLAVSGPLLIFALPLADTLVAIVRRLFTREAADSARGSFAAQPLRRLVTGDRAHIHHRLLQLGLSQRSAVFVLYGFMVVCCAVALLIMEPK